MRMPDGISPGASVLLLFITVRKLYSAEKSLANFIKFYKESNFVLKIIRAYVIVHIEQIMQSII